MDEIKYKKLNFWQNIMLVLNVLFLLLTTILFVLEVCIILKNIFWVYFFISLTILTSITCVMLYIFKKHILKNNSNLINNLNSQTPSLPFVKQNKLDIKYLLYYANNKNMRIFNIVKTITLLIIPISIIIAIITVLASLRLDGTIIGILMFCLVLAGFCFLAMLGIAVEISETKKELTTEEKQDIYNCLSKNILPKKYTPKNYKFEKFVMMFIPLNISTSLQMLNTTLQNVNKSNDTKNIDDNIDDNKDINKNNN